MEEEIIRTYKGTDAFMLESADTMQASFVLDQAEFEAFDTQLTVGFGTDWKNAIDAAYAEEGDNTVKAQIEAETVAVQTAMQKCRDAYTDIIYFAGKAFGDNSPRLKEFGRGSAYRSAYNNQPKLVEFMDELVEVTARYNTELTNAGCSAPVLAMPATALAELRSLNVNQNQSIKGRPTITAERVSKLNAAYEFMRTVTEAAKRVYRTNPAKLGLYTYTPNTSGGNEIYNGTLAPSEVRTVVPAGVIDRDVATFKVKNKGTTTLRMVVSELLGSPPVETAELNPGAEISITGASLPVLSQYLLVLQNLSTTQPGSYRVEVDD